MVMVKVKVVVPPGLMLAAPNALLIDGGDKTVIEALAVVPVPLSVEVTALVVLFFTPAVVAVTSTVTRQVPPEESIPPLKLRVRSPAVGVNIPPQESEAFGVAATCRPAGNVSLNAIPLSELAFGLFSMNINVTVPFSGIVLSVTIAVPPPEAERPLLPSVYVNVVAVGTLPIVNVPS